jgi:zinc transport system substrate-binding protein
MKKAFLVFAICFSSLLFAKVNVAVSIIPQQEFVKAIGGDKVTTLLMVEPGNSPHMYEPKASQMKELSKANIYFLIGVEFEKAWIQRFQTQNQNMQLVDSTKGIKKIPMQGHDEHEEDADHEEHEHEHGSLDPHVWTSPTNIRIIGKNIYDALVRIDPTNKQYYKKNFDTFNAKLYKINNQIVTILKDVPKDSVFMVFHPAWGYFAKEYNLKQLPIEVSGKEPKPKELMNLMQTAKKEKVHAIFTQPEFSDKSAKIMAQELHLKVIKVSPLQKAWDKQLVKIAKSIANK